ncbi:SusD/RagB family nutrient-binding outer membrane lipoprotein [Mucilaginibacter paludis]|uniref:Lipoprotein n=1 Tax=Mucilaginibacter paludis DSM 18603 TaxID=714943 RepID=H1Y6W2_9SPHI|nr:SusD/RagB family nutrient-binding outer membrane lipoprotein [Mucilaginibacter paludis]EHQ28369.1 hypothetical protein Mucpa_4279 [Mucilaginibacter paludis DSM 18603]
MKIKGIIGMIAASAVIATSCNKYVDVNQNPNSPTTVSPTVQLPNTEIAIAFANSNDLDRATEVMMQHNASIANQVAGYDIYNLRGNFDNQWDFEIYNGAVSSCANLIKQTQSTNSAFAGIAKIELAYAFSLATDLWGDVPYSQAGQGLTFIQPRFDAQQDIYQGNTALGITSLFDLVKSGIADLKANTGALKPGNEDFVYKGDLTKWIRAGNTMLLKFAMQISNVNPTLSQSTISAVIADNNYINSTSQDLEVPFGSSVGNYNPLYSFNNVNRTGDQMLSTRFLTLMNNLKDPRLGKFYTSPNGVFTSFDNGASAAIAAPAAATRSKYNVYLTGASGEAPIRILTNYQRAFILAEAALLYPSLGLNAQALYVEGITASMLKTGIAQADVTAYLAANPTVATLSGTTDQMRIQIITQKYIAFTGNGIEAYNDYRRTGYPALALALNAQGDDPNSIPKRFPYTNNEIQRNTNVPKPQPLTSVKVWWAK